MFGEKTILVTGGYGFVGSELIRQLLKTDVKMLINIGKLMYAGHKENLLAIENDNRYEFVHADICQYDALGKVFVIHKPDIVFHLAAESHVDRSISAPISFIRIN